MQSPPIMPPRLKSQKNQPAVPTWGWWVIGGFVALLACLFIAASGIAGKAMDSIGSGIISLFSLGFGLVMVLLVGIVYFLPWLIAIKTPRAAAIFVANLVFGWTIIGWIILLIWALAESGTMNKPHPR